MKYIKELQMGDYKYLVTSNGQVFTTPHTVYFDNGHVQHYKMHECSQWIQSLETEKDAGYMMVSIKMKKNEPSKIIPVHRMVAMAFLDNPDNLSEVNHKDGNKKNNNVDNLEWCTYSYNLQHAHLMGLHKYDSLMKKVYCEELDHTFDSVSQASQTLKINKRGIALCAGGHLKSYKKYHFKYV